MFYDNGGCYLYFVDSPQELIEKTIRAALAGLRSNAVVEQLYLDSHKIFIGARRVRLAEKHAETVLVALRLTGVRTTVQRVARRPISTKRAIPG